MAIGARKSQKRVHQSAEPDDLPECVCGMMRMVTRAVTQIYDDAMRPSGLRVTQFSLLSRLDRVGLVNAASLVDALHADQTTLARALKVLENDGLIHRVPQSDQRVKLIELTPKGRKCLAAARIIWRKAQTQMVEQIGREQWQDMRLRLGGILGALGPVRDSAGS